MLSVITPATKRDLTLLSTVKAELQITDRSQDAELRRYISQASDAVTKHCNRTFALETSLDAGQTWIDIACFAFTTSSGIKVINLSGLTPVTTAITPSDGTMADNTVQDGILGSSIRVKLTTTGTFANSLLSVKLSAR